MNATFDVFGNFQKIRDSMVYYVVDYSATGEGRSFWYASVPRDISEEERWRVFTECFDESEEFWSYYKPSLEVYEDYVELSRKYHFMPDTWLPATHMHIRWL